MLKKWIDHLIPKGFLSRLTFVNVIMMGVVILLSGWALYETACFLVEDLGNTSGINQQKFNKQLFQYLLIFSIMSIVVGGVFHFYFVRKITKPLQKVIQTTKELKKGKYPKPIQISSIDEIGMLIEQHNQMIKQLKRNDSQRKELISNLSHEFRTPLANLKGYLDALENGVISGDKQLYKSLSNEADRLVLMMEQFEQLKEWDYAHSQRTFVKERVFMDQLIGQCVAMFELKLAKENIPYHLETEVIKVSLQVEGIQQVISNLLENAIRYYDGENSILIKGEQINQKQYKVSIIGPSPFIPPHEEKAIFERFYRLDHSRTRKTGGSGLGLAIAKEVVEKHEGKIGVKRIKEKNHFWFTLPLVD